MLLQALAETRLRLICLPFLNAVGGANTPEIVFSTMRVFQTLFICNYYHYKNTSLITSDILIQQISTLANWLVTGHQPLKKNHPSFLRGVGTIPMQYTLLIAHKIHYTGHRTYCTDHGFPIWVHVILGKTQGSNVNIYIAILKICQQILLLLCCAADHDLRAAVDKGSTEA